MAVRSKAGDTSEEGAPSAVPVDDALAAQVGRLVEDFIASGADGRRAIARLAREVRGSTDSA